MTPSHPSSHVPPPRPDWQAAPDEDADARIAAAVSRAQEAAVRRRRLLGQPVVVWRDGRAVEVPAAEPPAGDGQA